MAIEVTLEGRLEEENDFEGYMKFIQETAIQNQLKMEIYEDCAVIDVCPEGYIEISCENLYVSISAQTNVAGPGFHAFVCDFFAQIQKQSPIALNANDPTGYYDRRNFNHLKYGIFHRWLADIALPSHMPQYLPTNDEIRNFSSLVGRYCGICEGRAKYSVRALYIMAFGLLSTET